MNDDELVDRLRAGMGALPEVVVAQPRVWDAVRRRRRARVAAVGTVGVLVVALGAVTAVGAPWAADRAPETAATVVGPTATAAPDPTPSPTATSAMDCVLEPEEAAQEIVGWTQEQQDAIVAFIGKVDGVMQGDPGYADFGAVYGPPGIQIWSAGPLPAALDPVIAEAEAAGLRIVHTQTAYGSAELETATMALADALTGAGITLGSIGPARGYSSLQVGGPVISTDCATQARVLDIARVTIGDIPVEFVADIGPAAPAVELEHPASARPASAMDCVTPMSSGDAQTVYGRVELDTATMELAEALTAWGIVWGSIGPARDFTSLEVGGPVVSTDCRTQAQVLDIARSAIGDIPVTFIADQGSISDFTELER